MHKDKGSELNQGLYVYDYHQRNKGRGDVQVGKVLKFYPRTHTADVVLLRFGYDPVNGRAAVLRSLPVTVQHGGAGWGEFRGLAKNQLVEVTLDNGSDNHGKITGVLYTNNEQKPPQHPALLGKGSVHAKFHQQPIDAGHPGSYDYWGADGTHHIGVLTTEAKEGTGSASARQRGPSFTRAELQLQASKDFQDQATEQFAEMEKATSELATLGEQIARATEQLESLKTDTFLTTMPGIDLNTAGSTSQVTAVRQRLMTQIGGLQKELMTKTQLVSQMAKNSTTLLADSVTAGKDAALSLANVVTAEVKATAKIVESTILDPSSVLQ